jgi:hypothetical protein
MLTVATMAPSFYLPNEPGLRAAVVCQDPAVADLDELKIPKVLRPVAEDIILITDQVCAKLLDASEEPGSAGGS